jgi:hypothetical protein
MVCLMTSPGPVKVDPADCNLILTSSKGVTRKDSVAPAAQPVRMEMDWVMGMVDFWVKMSPQKALAATAMERIRKGGDLKMSEHLDGMQQSDESG